jgi:hypothetical protein
VRGDLLERREPCAAVSRPLDLWLQSRSRDASS